MNIGRTLSYLAIVLFALGSYARPAHAKRTHCLVVSGKRYDHNHAFAASHFLDETHSSLLGEKCQIFDSWKDLKTYFTLHLSALDPSQNQFFIFQGAHGAKEGNALCNAGFDSADSILEILDHISARYQTSSVLHSCFSGDVMKRKISRDTEHSPSLSNLCLATSSTIGEVTYSRPESIFLHLVPGMNMEEAFLAFEDGLLSSAEWDGSGTTQYLQNRDFLSGIEALSSLTKSRIVDSKCTLAVKLCQDPLATRRELDDFFYSPVPFERENLFRPISPGESPTPETAKLEILHRILGIETDTPLSSAQEVCKQENRTHKYSNVIRNFVKSSLNAGHLSSPIDQARRSACRNFYFKGIDKTGYSSLVFAACSGKIDTVAILLQGNVNLNATANPEMISALGCAATFGYSAIVELLLSKGAQINIRDVNLLTPLAHAVIGGHVEVVDLLLKKGADPRAKDRSGLRILDLAKKSLAPDNAKIIELIDQAKIDLPRAKRRRINP